MDLSLFLVFFVVGGVVAAGIVDLEPDAVDGVLVFEDADVDADRGLFLEDVFDFFSFFFLFSSSLSSSWSTSGQLMLILFIAG